MRIKGYNVIKRVFVLFLVAQVCLCMPHTTLADAASLDNDAGSDHGVISPEELVSLGNESYTYSPPNDSDFQVLHVTGSVYFENDMCCILFEGSQVVLPLFDYYRIVDGEGNLRFYQGDVLKDPNQTNGIVYIALYVDGGPSYSIHVQYVRDDEQKMYDIKAPLVEEEFLYFTCNATELCLGADEVSQRLKSSGRVYKHGSVESCEYFEAIDANHSIADNDAAVSLALNNIAANTYDVYTNSDGIIHDYVDDYLWECYLSDGITITDDPIVDIVPKELCFIPGEHIYIGKEYGFFIRVVTDTLDPNDYAVDILIFDFVHYTPSFTTSETGYSKVVPLFQYTYRAAATSSLTSPVDASLDRVVFPHLHYDFAEYFLKDIGFRFTIDNPSELNPGDPGYDPYNDNGAFMIQTRLNASGVGLKKKNGSFLYDTALFTLGFVPYVGPILSVLSYGHDLYNGFGNDDYFYTHPPVQLSDNEININTLKTNSTDQIAAYGNLIKSQSVKLTSDPEKPRLINVGGGYVEAKYVIARKSGSNYNKIRVTTSISVSVVEDNTSVFLGIESGEVIEYGRGTGTYETGGYTRRNNVALDGTNSTLVPANGQTNIIRIIPKVSGDYKIFTSVAVGDPNFRITNATAGTSVINATDDIDGENDRNALLKINLVAGNVYYIEAYRYGGQFAYTLYSSFDPVATRTLTLDVPCSIYIPQDSYQMVKFAPSVTGYYEISTDSPGDPKLFVFLSSGMHVGSDDDSGGDLEAYLRLRLVAGYEYYIAVREYDGEATSLVLSISQD